MTDISNSIECRHDLPGSKGREGAVKQYVNGKREDYCAHDIRTEGGVVTMEHVMKRVHSDIDGYDNQWEAWDVILLNPKDGEIRIDYY